MKPEDNRLLLVLAAILAGIVLYGISDYNSPEMRELAKQPAPICPSPAARAASE